MSQHDQVITNADGATVRADINAAIAALFGMSSGATAPATTVAYQPWADTTTGILKQRNAANSGWVSIANMADWSMPVLTASGGSALVGFLQAGTGAAARTLQAKLRDVVSVLDFGAVGNGIADDTTKIIAADAAVAAAGGGMLLFPFGTYLFDGDITPSAGVEWQGVGAQQYMPKLKAASSTGRVLVTNSCGLRNLYIEGSVSTPGALVGTGLQIGSTTHVGHVTIKNVFIRYFQTGVRMAAALWTRFENCRFEYNRIGVDWNAGSATMYSTTVTFDDCVSANNERNGIGATYTPYRNIAIRWCGGSIESNSSVAPATYPQIDFGSVGNFELRTYIEYATAGTKPNAINSTGMSQGEISCYINGANNGVIDATGGTSDVIISACTFIAITTRNIDLASVTRVLAFANYGDGSAASANVLTGTGSKDMASYKPVGLQVAEALHTATLTGSSGTAAHTYVWQYMYYRQIDGRVEFNGVVRISAKDAGMTGNARISLPIASASDVANYTLVTLMCSNVTASANTNGFVGYISSGSSLLEIYEQSSNGGAATPLPSSAISATTIIYFSGSYKVV